MLSVIVTVYNGESVVGQQLEALTRQSYAEPFEVIVADNGSTDGSAAVVESFYGKVPNLRRIEVTDGQGPAFARNAGIRASAGDQILTIDHDDIIAADYVKNMARALDEYEMVGGRLDYTKLNPPWARPFGEPLQSRSIATYFGQFPGVATSALGFRRSVIDLVGPFDGSMRIGDDVDFSARAAQAGVRIGFADDAVVHYRMRSTLKDRFSQGKGYGYGRVLLEERYPVAPDSAAGAGAGKLGRLAKTFAQAAFQPRRTGLAAATRLGIIVGERNARRDTR